MASLKESASKEVPEERSAIAAASRSAVSDPSLKTGVKSHQSRPLGQLLNQWRSASAAIARHPTLMQIVFLLLLISGTGCFLLYSLFKGAWSPDKDNLSILNAIFRMELARESALAIEGDPQQVVTRSYQSLEPYVAAEDWTWINRFGSTTTYGKQDQRLIASCSAYSPLYLVCNLSEIP